MLQRMKLRGNCCGGWRPHRLCPWKLSDFGTLLKRGIGECFRRSDWTSVARRMHARRLQRRRRWRPLRRMRHVEIQSRSRGSRCWRDIGRPTRGRIFVDAMFIGLVRFQKILVAKLSIAQLAISFEVENSLARILLRFNDFRLFRGTF